MEYTVIVNGKSYDLPKKTIAVAESLEEVLKVDSTNLKIRQKMEKLHRFSKDLLGEDNVKEILGTDDLEEADTSALAMLVLNINEAYEKPVTEYRTDKMREAFNGIPTEKLSSLTKSMQTVMNVQEVSRCKRY